MKANYRLVVFGISAAVSVGALSCGYKAREAKAPKDLLEFTALRNIPYTEVMANPAYNKETGIELAGATNVIFTWKNNPETDGQIMRYNDEIGELLDEAPAKVLTADVEKLNEIKARLSAGADPAEVKQEIAALEPFTGHIEKTASGVEGVVFYDRASFRDWQTRLKDADSENDQEPEKFAVILHTESGVVGYNTESSTKVEVEQRRFPLAAMQEFQGTRMDNIVKYKTIYTVAGMLAQAQAGEKKLVAGINTINQGLASLQQKKTELASQETALGEQIANDPNNDELKTKLAEVKAGQAQVDVQIAGTETKKVDTEKQLATVQGQIAMLQKKIEGVPAEVIADAPTMTAWLAQPVLNRKKNIAVLADYFPFSKTDGQSGLAPKVNLKFDDAGKPRLNLVWDIDGFEGSMVNSKDQIDLGFGKSKPEQEKLAALHKSVSTFSTEVAEGAEPSIISAEYVELGGVVKLAVKPWNNIALKTYLEDKLARAYAKYDMIEVKRLKETIGLAKSTYEMRMERAVSEQQDPNTKSITFMGGMSQKDESGNKRLGQVKIGL